MRRGASVAVAVALLTVATACSHSSQKPRASTTSSTSATTAPVAVPAADPNDPPPAGANNWSCRPSGAHREPVVLVHGLGSTMALNWFYLSPLLVARGFCVFALTYGRNPAAPPPLDKAGGLMPMEQSAGELRDFVGKVLQVTGASKVDIVGHSEGSLMPDYYVKFLGGASQVNHYVGLAPLWNGSTVSLATLMAAATSNYTAYCAACSQVLTGSPFLQNLNAGGAAVPGVRYTMVLSKLDGIVTPYTSGVLQGADNVVVQDLCATDSATHAALAGDPVAAQVVFNALSPGSVPQVQCAPVGSPPP